jgi:hypothetical protein
VKHDRVFQIELVGAADTIPDLTDKLSGISEELSGRVHRITEIQCQELTSARFGVIGHRYTITVSVLV